jgi:predicted PurR-regulated permease PerM
MTDVKPTGSDAHQVDRAIEGAIRVTIVALLVYWCFLILSPFIVPVLWGVIIAIGVFPLFRKFRSACGDRDKLAAVLFTLIALALLITPSVLLAESAYNGMRALATGLTEATLTVPPPPDSVAGWPVIGDPLFKLWSLASTNLKEAVAQLAPHVRDHGASVLSAAAGAGFVVVQFAISIIIAGAFLAKPAGGKRAAEVICTRLAGDRAGSLVPLAEATIRSVVQGVLGVAVIQAVAAGLGLLVAGVPLAGLWALLVLVLAVVQLPSILILGPIILYVFSVDTTTTAVCFMIWSLIVGSSDTFLKPLFLGRGVDVPMLVILLGAIGGMILHGILGLFVGAVVLALTYKLYQAWIGAQPVPEPE